MIVCCDSAASFYQDKFTKALPTVVMNAPDDRHMKNKAEPKHDVRSQCHLSNETPLVVYTGSVGLEARGVNKIVQALSFLPEYHLAVIGPRNPRFDSWLKKIITQEQLSKRVHLLKPAPQEILIDVLRTGDVGVCAFQDVSLNHRYALPNKIFEMAFAGLPLCLSNLVEMGKFINTVGNGLLMNETDPKDIARAIKEVVEHKEKYAPTPDTMKILFDKYSWSKQAERLLGLYQRNVA